MFDWNRGPTHYALLVGIDAYPTTEASKPLKGCVRDVHVMKELLDGVPEPGVQTRVLTASLASQTTDPCLAGGPDSWPTHDNVIDAIKDITQHAKEGDFVYMHFSGHGTTFRPPHESDLRAFSNPSTGNLALVLLQQDGSDIQYLRPYTLASELKNMTDKKLVVTLVLDCCFSGSLMRDDASIRYLEYDPQVDSRHPSVPELGSNFMDTAEYPTYRNASLRPNWLVNPKGYTVITACGPTEKAKERTFNDQFHGVLSYFLTDTFTKLGGVGGKLQYIHQLLRTRVQNVSDLANKQTPMFYGNKELDFFGFGNSRIGPAPVPIIRRQDGSCQMEAGQAHDVRESDIFAISAVALDAATTASYENFCTAQVISVEPLSSTVKLSATTIPDDVTMIATALTRLSLKDIPIRLDIGFPYPESWTKALGEESSLHIYSAHDDDGKRDHSFNVALSDLGCYNIRDGMSRLLWEHFASSVEPGDDVALVLRSLEHLAKFESFKRLENHSLADPTDWFRRSFSARLIGPAGEEMNPGCSKTGQIQTVCTHPECVIEVEEGTSVKLEVKNNGYGGDPDLYLHPHCMGSSWEIENINEGSYAVIPPRGSNSNRSEQFEADTSGVWSQELEMTLPSASGKKAKNQCEDILKLFITSKPTSFLTLEMPELDDVLAREGPVRYRGSRESKTAEVWIALSFRILTRMKRS